MADMFAANGAAHGRQSTSTTIPLSAVLLNRRITFPFIADVFNIQRLPANTKVKDGELLWFLSPSTGPTPSECVKCCRWSDPEHIFDIRGDLGVQLRLKNHWISTRSRLSSRCVGPSLSVHSAVNLARPKEPIFAVPADSTDSKYAFLKKGPTGNGGDVGWRGRIVVLGKEDEQGYLAMGTTRNFVIPKDFKEKFLFDERPKERSTVFKTAKDILNARCLEKIRVTVPINNTNAIDPVNVGDILELHGGGLTETRIDPYTGDDIEVVVFKRFQAKRKPSSQPMIIHIPSLARCDFVCIQLDYNTLQEYSASGNTFPAKNVKFCDTCTTETHSMDHVVLQEESPMTIVGVVSFKVTHISLHLNDPSFPALQASQTIPEYYEFNITPASQIPIDSVYLDIDHFQKPQRAIHVLTPVQFKGLQKRLEAENVKRNRSQASIPHETLQQDTRVDSDGAIQPYMNIPIPFQEQTQDPSSVSNGHDVSDDDTDGNNNNSQDDSCHDYMNIPTGQEGNVDDAITAGDQERDDAIAADDKKPTLERHQFLASSNITQSYVSPPHPVVRSPDEIRQLPSGDSQDPVQTEYKPPPGYINMPKQRSFEDRDDVFDTPPLIPAKSKSYSSPNILEVEYEVEVPKQFSERVDQRSKSVDSQLSETQFEFDKPLPKPPQNERQLQSAAGPSNKPRQPNKPKPPPTASKPNKKPGPPVRAKPTTRPITAKTAANDSVKPSTNPARNVFDLRQQISFQLKAGKEKNRMDKELPAATSVETNNNEQPSAVSSSHHPVAQPRRALSPPNRPVPSRSQGPPIGGIAITPLTVNSPAVTYRPPDPVSAPIRHWDPGSAPIRPRNPGCAPFRPRNPGCAPFTPQDPESAPFRPQDPGNALLRPSRVAPSRPLPPRSDPKEEDSSDDGDYQDIDANDYEHLDEFISQSPTDLPADITDTPPRLPPMATHPVMARGGPAPRPRRR